MYAGVDKYGGALVGEGQPNGTTSHATKSSGLSLEEAIETAAAEETVVVDVPYSYVADENDPSSVVSGVSTVLLSAQLNPKAGGLMWVEQSNAQNVYQNVVAMSQMTSMLRDNDRNDCYERGIARAMATFRATHGRDPLVLDIGTGTGLLSMFAARHGAAHVYACEMFPPMAAIAHQVTRANFPDKITVFPLRSTDLTVMPRHACDRDPTTVYHLPCRADVLVSELFDSVLLGEAVLPTLRHAMAHLLTPDAMIVPERATVFAQLIESDLIYHFTSFETAESGPTLARSDTAWQCHGGKPGLPVHFQAFKDQARELSTPSPVVHFDFTTPSSTDAACHETRVHAVARGTIHAVLMWWQVSFDANDTLVYSTAPEAQNWQDHWVPVVFPLVHKTRVQPRQLVVIRAQYHDCGLWFDVETHPARHHVTSVDRPLCSCGLHLICNAERIAMLTDRARRAAYTAAMASVVAALKTATSGSRLACLDISDGSLLALVAASLADVQSVTSIESKDVSARIFHQIASYTRAPVKVLHCGVVGLRPEHLHKAPSSVELLVGEPFYYAMQNLPLWQLVNFWLRRTAVNHLLSPTARVVPARARIVAQAVQFEHLHQSFGTVGHVSGFDHAHFDQYQADYDVLDFPFPVYMYPYAPRSDVVEVAVLELMQVAHTVATRGRIEVEDVAVNAVIVWVEYLLDGTGQYVVTTGPAVRYAKQLVRFLPVPDCRRDGPHELAFTFCFDALDGTIKLHFGWKD